VSAKLKAQCPHCQAVLTIDRPNEPRTAPCPACSGLIQIPEDIVSVNATVRRPNTTSSPPVAKQNAAEPVAAASIRSSQRVPFIIGGILLAVVSGLMALRGTGNDVAQAVQINGQIQKELRAENRESEMDELRARKARLETEIRNLESSLKRADDDIRQLLNQESVSPQQVQSAFEGVRL